MLISSHSAMTKNPSNQTKPAWRQCVFLLVITSLGVGIICTTLLAANHWLIDRPLSSLNPVRWVLSVAWLVGWVFGRTHSQNATATLIGALLASSTLVFIFLFVMAVGIRSFTSTSRSE